MLITAVVIAVEMSAVTFLPEPEFIANHPFLYLMLKGNCIAFIGKVSNFQ